MKFLLLDQEKRTPERNHCLLLMLFLLLLSLRISAAPSFDFTFPNNNIIVMPGVPTSFPTGSIYHIATITSDAPDWRVSPVPSLDNHIWRTYISSTSSEAFLYNTSPLKYWIVSQDDYNHTFLNTPDYTGFGSFNLDLGPVVTANGGYYIFVEIKTSEVISHCKSITFNFKSVWKNMTVGSSGYTEKNASTTIHFSRYTNSHAEWNASDLFIKDNDKDIGYEPNWQSTTADITRSVSINNSLYATMPRTYNGLNPGLANSNYAQRSTLGNLNKMNVWIENRGCVATTQPATMHVYWTVARVWEPWGSDWHNHVMNPSFASQNYTNWRNPANGGIEEPKPMGNHITLTDPFNYESSVKSITIPAGLAPTKYDGSTYTGGHLATISWNPPDAAWYNSASNIFRYNSQPVLCYLAVINEPNKPNDGFYKQYANNSNARITDFALYNNNVATVNSYLATPNGLYKTDIGNNRYRSITGTIRINNPEARNVVNLSVVSDQTLPNIGNNGTVYVLFDEFLWQRWQTSSNFAGTGFEIVSPQVVRITNKNTATFTGFQLTDRDEGTLGVLFEYDGNNPPDADYMYGLSIGAFEENPNVHIGSPTYFNTHILHTPMLDEQTESSYIQSTGINSLAGVCDFVTAYPNPVENEVTVSFLLQELAHTIDIKIYDLTLKELVTKQYNFVAAGSQTLKLDASELAQGQYLLKLTVDGKHQTIKISKK